jgi:outer membrane protein OmpA-like peptidoglycan-associated protein
MLTLKDAVLTRSRRQRVWTALPFLSCLAFAQSASAQSAQGGWQAGGQVSAEPPAGQLSVQPQAPGQFSAPPQPQPGQFSAQPAQGSIAPVSARPVTPSAASEEEERDYSLIEHNNTQGSTGLLRTSYAGSGASGTFRVSFLTDWFTASDFLCDASSTTPDGRPRICNASGQSDSASHVGAFFAVSATPLPFLEAFIGLRTYANSNDQGRPELLQVLGDTTLGVKAFLPPHLGQIFTFGGEAQLHLLNGSGSLGPAGGGTSATFRGLGSADFRKPAGAGIPLRVNLNLGYRLDNSGKLVEDTERARAKNGGFTDGRQIQPISRIERFGLGINKVDFFQIALGVEAPLQLIQPYVEYSVDVPVNRQGYVCHSARVSPGDECLGLDDFASTDPENQGGPGFAAVPSRITLGTRVSPFKNAFRGLSGHVAFDIGTSGTSTFIEEVAPQAPWTLYLGVGYAFDTKTKPTPEPKIVEAPPKIVEAPQHFIRGLVHEGNTTTPVVDAIATVQSGAGMGPVATDANGRFVTHNLPPGAYTFDIKAPGYKPGTCAGVIPFANAAPLPGQPADQLAPPPGQFSAQPTPFGQQPGAVGQLPAAPAEAPAGPTYVDVDCALEALPKLGGIAGSVKDAEGGGPVAGATAKLTDAEGKVSTGSADASGGFTFKDVKPGAATLTIEAPGYMAHVQQVDVRANEEARVSAQLNKRPKKANVKIVGSEIKLSKQIHFETDSAKIVGDSNALLEEIADVMQQNPNLKQIEIQGHTDNTGTRDRNATLSQQRADAVRQWLIQHGISGSRLTAKGYGQERPLSPNVTAANRARNRRVQFIILEK